MKSLNERRTSRTSDTNSRIGSTPFEALTIGQNCWNPLAPNLRPSGIDSPREPPPMLGSPPTLNTPQIASARPHPLGQRTLIESRLSLGFRWMEKPHASSRSATVRHHLRTAICSRLTWTYRCAYARGAHLFLPNRNGAKTPNGNVASVNAVPPNSPPYVRPHQGRLASSDPPCSRSV